jgi:hypothetical protein
VTASVSTSVLILCDADTNHSIQHTIFNDPEQQCQ